jgi:8-oxo-dGTP pyrophosphatase MutT (NUDIX family)
MNHSPLVGTDSADSSVFPVDFREAHQEGIPHRAVHIEIRQGDQFLVWRRDDGRWEVPGGHVDWLEAANAPESYFDAALRELFEELNLEVNWRMPSRDALARLATHLLPVGHIVNQLPSSHGNNNEHVGLFQLTWQSAWGDPCTYVRGPEMHSKPCWMPLAEIHRLAADNPTKINAALRLFLARHGILIPLRRPG